MKLLSLLAAGTALALAPFAVAQDGVQTRTLKTRCLLFRTDMKVPQLYAHQPAASPDTQGVPVKIKGYLNHEAEIITLSGNEIVFTTDPARASIKAADKQVARLKVPDKLRSAILMFLPAGGTPELPKLQVLPIDDSVRAFPRGSLKVVNLSHFPLRIELEKKPFDFKSGEIRSIEDPPVGAANASAMLAFTFKENQWQRIGAGSWPHPGQKRVLQIAFDNPASHNVEMSGVRDIAVRDN